MELMKDSQGKVRAPALVALVVALHGIIIGSVLFVQGCGTTRAGKQSADAPPAPMMPPRPGADVPGSAVTPKPVFQPPVSVDQPASAGEAAGGQTYAIAKGDSLSRIASRYGVSAREIAELNNIKDPNKIRIGQKILLPAYASENPQSKPAKKAATESKPSKKSSTAAVAGPGEYIVKSGDSLSKIASRNGTTVKAIKESNNLKSDMIRIGQKLSVPGAQKDAPKKESAPAPAPAIEPTPAPAAAVETAVAPVPPPPAAAPAESSAIVPFEYQLKEGETIDDVARNFAVLKQDILTLNGMSDGAGVAAGQKIKIPLSSP